ncbi:MAG: CDF family Co(II)/Ni(II) efflux transporter DmeF [Sphingomonas sp.]|nr:CDF family Co(II)/Ni(II) efflux transporter DmeF [Sphingomonas sp.]
MHSHDLDHYAHSHRFAGAAERDSERRTLLVVALTGAMMIVEIVAGVLTGSMALLADGWHMGSHFAALGLAAFAYRFARRHAENRSYTFGTGKVGPLAGFASAVALGLIALGMAYESTWRLFNPVEIAFSTALIVAAVGLAVNLASALLLGGHHHHHHHHHHARHVHDDHHHESHDRGQRHDEGHHHDHNLRAAYVHVLADALTSVLAILALAGGALLGIRWLDAVMGIVGAAVILWWSWTLIRNSSSVLLDREADAAAAETVRALIESDADNRIADLHLWQVGTGHLALIVSVVTHHPRPPAHYKALLARVANLSHVTVEVVPCRASHLMAA